MFQGSSLEAYDGSLKLQMPGDYNNVKGKKVIKDTIKEVIHRSKHSGLNNQEIETLEKINNEINR